MYTVDISAIIDSVQTSTHREPNPRAHIDSCSPGCTQPKYCGMWILRFCLYRTRWDGYQRRVLVSWSYLIWTNSEATGRARRKFLRRMSKRKNTLSLGPEPVSKLFQNYFLLVIRLAISRSRGRSRGDCVEEVELGLEQQERHEAFINDVTFRQIWAASLHLFLSSSHKLPVSILLTVQTNQHCDLALKWFH